MTPLSILLETELKLSKEFLWMSSDIKLAITNLGGRLPFALLTKTLDTFENMPSIRTILQPFNASIAQRDDLAIDLMIDL